MRVNPLLDLIYKQFTTFFLFFSPILHIILAIDVMNESKILFGMFIVFALVNGFITFLTMMDIEHTRYKLLPPNYALTKYGVVYYTLNKKSDYYEVKFYLWTYRHWKEHDLFFIKTEGDSSEILKRVLDGLTEIKKELLDTKNLEIRKTNTLKYLKKSLKKEQTLLLDDELNKELEKL